MVTNEELINKAKSIVKPKKMKHGFTASDCGCALVTANDNIFLGVSIDTCSSMGFCAEHSAIAAMVTKGEYQIKKIVAVDEDGVVLPSDVLRIRMFVKNLKNAGIEFVSEEVSQHLNLLTHYQDFYNSNYDLEVNAKDVMDVFVSMYKNYDSTTIERETRRIYNALMEA